MAKPRTAARHRIRQVRSVKDPAFNAAHDLLRRTFPRVELLSRNDWIEVMRERAAGLWTDVNWHLLVAERRGRVIGAASGSYLGNWNLGVVGYIAVESDRRGQGLGGRLRSALREAFEADAHRIRRRRLDALVGEVHADNPWLAHVVRHSHAIALDFPYYQPSVRWLRRPVQLVLYYQPLGIHRRSLPANDVRQLVYTIWRRVYRVGRPMSSRVFRRMLEKLDRQGRVGQMKLPPR